MISVKTEAYESIRNKTRKDILNNNVVIRDFSYNMLHKVLWQAKNNNIKRFIIDELVIKKDKYGRQKKKKWT